MTAVMGLSISAHTPTTVSQESETQLFLGWEGVGGEGGGGSKWEQWGGDGMTRSHDLWGGEKVTPQVHIKSFETFWSQR